MLPCATISPKDDVDYYRRGFSSDPEADIKILTTLLDSEEWVGKVPTRFATLLRPPRIHLPFFRNDFDCLSLWVSLQHYNDYRKLVDRAKSYNLEEKDI